MDTNRKFFTRYEVEIMLASEYNRKYQEALEAAGVPVEEWNDDDVFVKEAEADSAYGSCELYKDWIWLPREEAEEQVGKDAVEECEEYHVFVDDCCPCMPAEVLDQWIAEDLEGMKEFFKQDAENLLEKLEKN